MDVRLDNLIREGQETYDEEIAGRGRWDLFYHLSSLRRAALEWYPVPEDAAVLEVGCGYGALTGVLLDKAGCVDAVDCDADCVRLTSKRYQTRGSLRVFHSDIDSYVPDRRYDLIVVIEFFEAYKGNTAQLLTRLQSWLTPSGVILAGFRNRNAFKYQCGLTDEIVTKTGAIDQKDTHLFTKKDFESAVQTADCGLPRYYYPMPDFGFTQAVYSDEWLPKATMRDRVIDYDPFGGGSAERAVYAHEHWDDVIAGEGFPDEANVILAEIGRSGDDQEHIVGAVLSADREREHAFSTEIYTDRVVKRPLHPEGAASLEQLCANLRRLQESGLNTVSFEYVKGTDANDGIVMPRYHAETYTDVIRRALREEPERVIELYEKLREEILKRACIDMIPDNAFYIDGKIVWFDQEFSKENCPADYVLYRALRYTWIHIREAQEIIPIEQLKEHFGLTDKWEEYTRIEDAFTNRNRNRRLYSDVYRWAWEVKPYGTGLVMGAFDLLHQGHRNLFDRAKGRCRYLRVGVLSDDLFEKYKGFRPSQDQETRLAQASACESVDETVLIEGEYVSKVAEWWKRPYDCFFSGDDHAGDAFWEKEKKELAELGASMEFFPYTQGVSSTAVRERAATLHGLRGYRIRIHVSHLAKTDVPAADAPDGKVGVKLIYAGAAGKKASDLPLHPENDPHIYTGYYSPFPEDPQMYVANELYRDAAGDLWTGYYMQAYLRDPVIFESGLKVVYEVPERLARKKPTVRIYCNGELLCEEKTVQAGIVGKTLDVSGVSANLISYMSDVHRQQRILYEEIVRLCSLNDIPCYLICGSLIGLVRDGMLIPWDDDLDLAVTREGYERLKEVALREWKDDSRFMWLSPDDYGEGVFYDFMTRVLYMEEPSKGDVFARIKGHGRSDIHNRQTVDIYILEEAPDSRVRHFLQTRRLQFLYMLALGHRPDFDPMKNKDHGRTVLALTRLINSVGRRTPLNRILRAAGKCARTYSLAERSDADTKKRGGSYYLSNGYYRTIPLRFKKEWFSSGRSMNDESTGETYLAPADPGAFLKTMYGNYQIYPYPWFRNPSHTEAEK